MVKSAAVEAVAPLSRSAPLWNATAQAAGVAVACAALEWSYYGGTSTFFDSFSEATQVGIALLAAGGLLVLLLLANLPFAVASYLWPSQARNLLALVPALALATMTVLLGERWFQPNEPEAEGWVWVAWRVLPAVVAVASFFRFRATLTTPPAILARWAAPGVLLVCLLWTVGQWLTDTPAATTPLGKRPPAKRPHVILLAADGIEARSMTMYGSPLDTTPFLATLARESIVYENAFANAAKTTGSTTSMMNGIHPLESKVMFPPQIFQGPESYSHLPRVFKEWGYQTLQSTIRFYADAEDLNMVGGFDVANGRALAPLPRFGPARSVALAVNDELYFLRRERGEVASTLKTFVTGEPHLGVFRSMRLNRGIGKDKDRATLQEALEFLDEADGPVFMHIHLLGTHCCKFRPSETLFSPEEADRLEGPVRSAKARALYLSTLRDFDANVEAFVQGLEERGLLDDTLLVVSSDHDTGWHTTQRMPLMIRTPGGELSGRVEDNVQLLSLPATLLHLLGFNRGAIPPWMHPDRMPLPAESDTLDDPVILSIDGIAAVDATGKLLGRSTLGDPGPPEYGLATLAVVYCDQWARWNVEEQEWSRGRIAGHTRPCAPALEPERLDAVLTQVHTWYGIDLVREPPASRPGAG